MFLEMVARIGGEMISLKIPVENQVEIVMCNLYLNVQVELKPLMPVQNKVAELTIDQLNQRLKQAGYEIAGLVCEQLEEKLKNK